MKRFKREWELGPLSGDVATSGHWNEFGLGISTNAHLCNHTVEIPGKAMSYHLLGIQCKVLWMRASLFLTIKYESKTISPQ